MLTVGLERAAGEHHRHRAARARALRRRAAAVRAAARACRLTRRPRRAADGRRRSCARRGIADERVLGGDGARAARALRPATSSRDRAYDDAALPIGAGPDDLAAVHGRRASARRSGCAATSACSTSAPAPGYQAAVLAELAGEVHSIERLPQLAERARAALAAAGYERVAGARRRRHARRSRARARSRRSPSPPPRRACRRRSTSSSCRAGGSSSRVGEPARAASSSVVVRSAGGPGGASASVPVPLRPAGRRRRGFDDRVAAPGVDAAVVALARPWPQLDRSRRHRGRRRAGQRAAAAAQLDPARSSSAPSAPAATSSTSPSTSRCSGRRPALPARRGRARSSSP